MPRDFYPRREADVLSWTNNFREQIGAAPPGSLGLTDEQARHYSDTQTAFAAAYRAANDPGTRTPVAVRVKNGLLRTLEKETRQLAAIIRAYPGAGVTGMGISDEMLGTLGLVVKSKPRKRVSRPMRAPLLYVNDVDGRTVKLRLHDADSMRKGRPRDVSGAVVFAFVGDLPPPVPGAGNVGGVDGWQFVRNVTRTKLNVTLHADVPPGTKVWFIAAWFNWRQERGPMCMPVYTHIGYGGPSLGKPVREIGGSLRFADHAPKALKQAA
jgi:hypothetical protein